MAKVEKKTSKVKPVHQEKSGSSMINSTDALAMIRHSSEINLTIITPVGTKFICKTIFIGTHSNSYILAEVPNISDNDFDFFFQEGFWTNIKAISQRGEGAVIHFRSQLLHVIHEPISLAMFSIPSTMQITPLRKESRYEVQLFGKICCSGYRMECEIRDISKNGCRFVTQPLGQAYLIDDEIMIDILSDADSQGLIGVLEGKICNIQRQGHYKCYGLEFSEAGKENARALLGKLRFNGTRLTLNTDS